EARAAERPQAREAQRTLAFDVTSLVHGEAAAQAAIDASAALFGRGAIQEIDEPTLAAALGEIGLYDAASSTPTIVELLQVAGIAKSNSEARRIVAEGGAYLNNVRVDDPEHVPASDDLLHGS